MYEFGVHEIQQHNPLTTLSFLCTVAITKMVQRKSPLHFEVIFFNEIFMGRNSKYRDNIGHLMLNKRGKK